MAEPLFDTAALESGVQNMFVGDAPGGGADAPAQRFDALYYVRPDGSPSGEVDLHQANQLMESGQLNGNTFVWADGMEEWAKLCDCKALFVVNLDNMKLHYETTTSLPSDVVTVREVRSSLRSGDIHAGTLVWAEGMDEWARLSECHSFFGLERDQIPPAREDGGGAGGATPVPVRSPKAGGGGGGAAAAPAPIAAPPTNGRLGGSDGGAAATELAAVPMPKSYGTDWNCRQRVALEKERVISSMEFDESGDYIALGDTGGNVSIMKRDRGGKAGDAEFGQHFDFSAHEPEFDALKSVEIPERVNCVRWVPKHRAGTTVLTCNDKTVKLWRVSEGGPTAAAYGTAPRPAIQAWGGAGGGGADGRGGGDSGGEPIGASALRLGSAPKKVRRAKQQRTFKNAHNYTMNSISCCSDGATFISSDDLRVYLWSYERADEAFLTLDLKPDNLEDLTEVITTSKFHPEHCHLLGYSNSRGQMKLHDLRQSALCSGHAAKLFHDTTTPGSPDGEGLFDELLASISDITFGGRQVRGRSEKRRPARHHPSIQLSV